MSRRGKGDAAIESFAAMLLQGAAHGLNDFMGAQIRAGAQVRVDNAKTQNAAALVVAKATAAAHLATHTAIVQSLQGNPQELREYRREIREEQQADALAARRRRLYADAEVRAGMQRQANGVASVLGGDPIQFDSEDIEENYKKLCRMNGISP